MSKHIDNPNTRPLDTGTDQLLCRIDEGVDIVAFNIFAKQSKPLSRNASQRFEAFEKIANYHSQRLRR